MKSYKEIVEEITGSNNPSNPSNAMFTGQVADNPNRRFFNKIYRRSKAQREMDERYKIMFDAVMKGGK